MNYKFQHIWKDEDHDTAKIIIIVDNIEAGYVSYEKIFNIEFMFSDDEIIAIQQANNKTLDDIFDTDCKAIYLDYLEVKPEFQKQGIGNLLMQEFNKHILELNFSDNIILNCCPYSQLKIEEKIPIKILSMFYKKFGFVELLDQKENILMYKKI